MLYIILTDWPIKLKIRGTLLYFVFFSFQESKDENYKRRLSNGRFSITTPNFGKNHHSKTKVKIFSFFLKFSEQSGRFEQKSTFFCVSIIIWWELMAKTK